VEKTLKTAAKGQASVVSFRTLLRMVLNDTGLKASTVAFELGRERTLVYKWLSGAVVPAASYFPLIVQIVARHAPRARRLILARDLRALLRGARIPPELKITLLRTESLETLLAECLELSLTPGFPDEKPGVSLAGSGRLWPVLPGALFAAVCGGILWNVLNRILGWPYFMGSPGEGLRGMPAFVWGLITTAPIPAPLLLLHRKQERRRMVVPALLFTLLGGLSALAFYSSGLRGIIEGLGLAYGLQESIIVVVFALFLSVPPYASAVLWPPRPSRAGRSAAAAAAPAAAALTGLLVTLVIDRPVPEVLQLRGFVVGFTLRLALFFALYAGMQRPDGGKGHPAGRAAEDAGRLRDA
jgi:hypothetical protein